jgi:DNA repair protein RadC
VDIITYKEKTKPNIRELTLSNGISYPSDEELLMLLLGGGTKRTPIELLSQQVLSVLNSSNEDDLIEKLNLIDGMGYSRSLQIAAALELGRRRKGYLKSVINEPADIVPYVKHFCIEPTEHFVTATVNGAHELLSIRVISVGTINRTLIHPREIFAQPVAEHASGIICCHNHPCGLCYPSRADIAATEMLQSASTIMGITFLDHLIITREGYFSFLEHDMLTEHRQGEKMEDEEALAMS